MQNPAAPKATWADCWKCTRFSPRHICTVQQDDEEAARSGQPLTSVPTTHVSLYAAQIAWWLSFFPPDRFLFLMSKDLHSPDGAMEVCSNSQFPHHTKQSVFVICCQLVHVHFLRHEVVAGWCVLTDTGRMVGVCWGFSLYVRISCIVHGMHVVE
jgi:hypothetical protein